MAVVHVYYGHNSYTMVMYYPLMEAVHIFIAECCYETNTCTQCSGVSVRACNGLPIHACTEPPEHACTGPLYMHLLERVIHSAQSKYKGGGHVSIPASKT